MSNRFFMLGFIVVALSLIAYFAINQIQKTSTTLAVKQTFSLINELGKNIQDEHSRGFRVGNSNYDLEKYKTQYVEILQISETGIIQLKFRDSLQPLANKWIFLVPAEREAGSGFSYVDRSSPQLSTSSEIFWICGVIQFNMANREFLPEDCQYILGPEYTEPN